MPVPERNIFDSAQEWFELKKKLIHNEQACLAAGLPNNLREEIERYVNNWGLIFGVIIEPDIRFVIGSCAVIRNSEMNDNSFEWLPIAPDVAISICGTSDNGYLLRLESEEVDRVNTASLVQSRIIAAQTKSDLERVIRLCFPARGGCQAYQNTPASPS